MNGGFLPGIRISIAKEPYSFVIIQGASGPPVPTLDSRIDCPVCIEI